MLPFLKKDRGMAGVLVQERKPDNTDSHDDKESGGLRQAAQDLLDAMNSDNVAGVESALRAAFQMLDSEEESAEPIQEDNQE